ncbi:MAG: hypothetical protein RR054_04415 [Clostridia bacterium]
MGKQILSSNNIYLQDYNTTITAHNWQKITEAVEYLSNQSTTLNDLQQVCNAMQRNHAETVFDIFMQEVWAMVGYMTTKIANK